MSRMVFPLQWQDRSRPQEGSLSDRSVSLILFFILVATAGVGQFIFYGFDTSPAVIWPPAGIALAAVLLRGYGMWIPIACAAFVASLMSPSKPEPALIIVATFAHTVAPLLGVYLLRLFRFEMSFATMRSALIFTVCALFIAAIAPTIIAAAQFLAGSLPDTLNVVWTRAWAGRLLSLLILTPLIVAWLPWRPFSLRTAWQKIEITAVLAALIASSYLLFWTPLAQSFSFLLLLALLVPLFWVALRLNFRAMVLGLFLVTVLGVLGPLVAPEASPTPLNQRLFSTELFLVLISPIFLAFSSIMKERRDGARLLRAHISRLEEAMQELNSRDEAKNEFIAILAHELRNPLAAILSSVELLKLGGDDAHESSALLKTMDERVRTTARILDDLLDTSRLSQNKLQLEKEVVAVCDIVDRSVATAQFPIHARGHTLSVTKPPEKIYLEADPVRLEQIFVNLLTNAAKYTEPGGVIGISVVREGRTAVVRVRDNGIGIPEHMFSRIFEPFFQIRQNRQQGTVGLGVGLSLTRRLVELHGGTIEAVSAGESQGSEFIVRLPVPVRVESSATADRKTLSGGRALRQAKNAQKILVVDDNEAAADALGKLLHMRGHDVSVAYGGAEALEKARESEPQVLIVDIQLPDMSGHEVARRLRSERSNGARPTLIALTGYGQHADKEKARKAGFDYHLTKPVGLKEIEVVLRKRPAKSPVRV